MIEWQKILTTQSVVENIQHLGYSIVKIRRCRMESEENVKFEEMSLEKIFSVI